jgi:hypothetical protein
LAGNPSIAGHVLAELRHPENSSRCRARCEATVLMPMPETAVHQYRNSVAMQDDVRPTGKIRGVQSNPISHSKDSSSNTQFRLGVLAADSRHDSTAHRLGHDVGHDFEA